MADAQNDLKALIYADESSWDLNQQVSPHQYKSTESMLGERIKPVINCVLHTADDDPCWQGRVEIFQAAIGCLRLDFAPPQSYEIK